MTSGPARASSASALASVPSSASGPRILVHGDWRRIFEEPVKRELEGVLSAYIQARRWFRSKSRVLRAAVIESALALPGDDGGAVLVVVRVAFAEDDGRDTERYVLPLAFRIQDEGVDVAPEESVGADLIVARLAVVDAASVTPGTPGARGDAEEGVLFDAVGRPATLEAMLDAVRRNLTVRADDGVLAFRAVLPPEGWGVVVGPPRVLAVEQSNTSIAFGRGCILKIVRRLDDGPGADLEMGEFLTRVGYTSAPPVLGAIELGRRSQPALPAPAKATVAIVHRFVPSEGDAWSFLLGRVEDVLAGKLPAFSTDGEVRSLARTVASLHAALAGGTEPTFRPEPIEGRERMVMAEVTGASFARALATLRDRHGALTDGARAQLDLVLENETVLRAILQRFTTTESRALKTRIHGDLHLGQVLRSGNEFMIIDFEGEPARSLAERKSKRSPFADVAGLLRSFHYAATAALRNRAQPSAGTIERARAWYESSVAAFIAAYFEGAPAAVLPLEARGRSDLLDYYRLEKCVYEVHYEMDNRPTWLEIPLAGLVQIAAGPHAA